MKLIIDCDAGLDDAMAIFMALDYVRKGKVEVLAITCVQGNTSVENSSRNVLRILDTMGIDHQIPVYKGARKALVQPYDWTHPPFHGNDGFGDVTFPDEPDVSRIPDEHGVAAMLRLANEHPGEITLILLGPVTNAALAMRMDHEFSSKLKAIHIMGGNYEVLGKTTSMEGPEFNFAGDPYAAYVLLQEVSCPLHLYSWELCEMRMGVSLEWRHNLLKSFGTPQAKLQDLIEEPSLKTYDFPEYLLCDQLALAGAINPSVVLNTSSYHATIELEDPRQRGRTIIDVEKRNGKKPNVVFVDDMDKQVLEEMILDAYQD